MIIYHPHVLCCKGFLSMLLSFLNSSFQNVNRCLWTSCYILCMYHLQMQYLSNKHVIVAFTNCFLDINECENNNGGCMQICENIQGSFSCLCDPGYTLSPDGRTCTGRLHFLLPYTHKHSWAICLCNPGHILSPDGKSCTCKMNFAMNHIYSIHTNQQTNTPEPAVSLTMDTPWHLVESLTQVSCTLSPPYMYTVT